MFGVVCFEQRETKREWTQEECGLAVDIGNLVSQIFLIDELRGQNELLQLLNNLTIGSGAAHSIEEFADSALELMARQYPKAFVGFYRYHKRENKLVLTDTTGYDWTGGLLVFRDPGQFCATGTGKRGCHTAAGLRPGPGFHPVCSRASPAHWPAHRCGSTSDLRWQDAGLHRDALIGSRRVGRKAATDLQYHQRHAIRGSG